MRTFIALDVPQDFADETAALARSLKDRVQGRFMKPETYHLTLAFLGDIDQRELGAAIAAADAACAGRAPIELACAGLGTFGRKSDATLWMGIADTRELASLAACVREELSRRDVPFDAKTFCPHITLARRAHVACADLGDLPFPRPDFAAHVTVYKSTLSPEGAAYKALHVRNLGA